MDANQIREARPGERCPCGKPAKVAHVRKMGDVLSCKTPEEYIQQVKEAYLLSRLGQLPSTGQSGAR